MITAEVIKGKPIAQNCDSYMLPENVLNEKLVVSEILVYNQTIIVDEKLRFLFKCILFYL